MRTGRAADRRAATYDCLLAMDDGRTGSLTVTADNDGHWTAVRK